MRHCLQILVTIVCAFGAAYFAWAQHRVGNSVLVFDTDFPRPSPYPDRWIVALNDWYDARHSAPPGGLNIHGQLPLVRLTIGVAFVVCLLGAGAGARMWWVQRLRRKRADR